MGRLQGKVAVVLGAAGKDNMAQVIARRFVAEGAKLVAAGRDLAALTAFAEPLGGIALACDITSKAEVDGLADSAVAHFGRVAIAVNATGWGFLAPFLGTSEADLAKIVELQFSGPFRFMQAMVRAMTQDGGEGGSIIQMSSATATIMLDNHAAYMGTKAGTDHVVRCVANEFGAQGVRANSISPGYTETPMTAEASATPGLKDAFIPSYPLGAHRNVGGHCGGGGVAGVRRMLHDGGKSAGEWRPGAARQPVRGADPAVGDAGDGRTIIARLIRPGDVPPPNRVRAVPSSGSCRTDCAAACRRSRSISAP
jgi:NAD(P)-dependent dehydrogenase (short-subunit alcohol dehydrogenase family)